MSTPHIVAKTGPSAALALALFLSVPAVLLTGCTATPREPRAAETARQALGRHQDELLSQWGPPTRSARLSDGGVVMTWTPWWGPQAQYPCEQTFRTDASGTVIHGSYRGCP